MNENKNINVFYSWPIIILAFVLFWPVGVILLLKRISVDKKTKLGVGKLLGIIGWVFIGFAGVGVVACLSDGFGSDDIAIMVFLVGLGLIFRGIAGSLRKEAALSKHYLAIVHDGVRRLDEISSATGKSYEAVKADLEKLIKKGYLENAYINESTRELVLTQDAPPKAAPVAAPVEKPARVVKCAGCGASNTVYGDTGECEYCGSPLK